jgi:uncharacterized protein (TIGR02466 family)
MSDFFDIFSLSLYKETNINLQQKLIPIAKKYLSDNKYLTNEWGYKNTYTFDEGLALSPEMCFFVDYILDVSKIMYERSGYTLDPQYKLWTSIFTSEMFYGDKHDAHCHPGALYSGLIYLNVPEGSSPIQFKNPKDPIFHKVMRTKSNKCGTINLDDDGTLTIEPHDGLFLMWDSWAFHRVPENKSTEGRMTIVFNVGVDYVCK